MTGNHYGCPKCGKEPSEISPSGMSGFCPIHEEWYALSQEMSAKAEAVKRNKMDQQKREEKAIELQKRQEKEIENRKKKQRRATVRKIGVTFLGFAIAAMIVFWFLVIPKANYRDAQTLLEQGAYQEAQEKFKSLGSYQDSEMQVLLCDALLCLQENDFSGAMQKMDELEQRSDSNMAEVLRTAMISMAADWRQHGISPETLLSLLKKAEIFDPDGALDQENLFIEAHAALAGAEEVLSWYTADMNEDQEDDLIVLKEDFSVTAYRMLADGNEKVTLDKARTAECLLNFGDRYTAEEEDEMALQCYQTAYDLRQDAATRQKVAKAYQARAIAYEAEENYEAALADCRYASDAFQTEDAFQFYYEMMTRYCYAQKDLGQAVALWDAFMKENETPLASFEMKENGQKMAGELRLEYAKNLAKWKDSTCLTWFQSAWEYGIDIEDGVLSSLEYFDVGKTRGELRLLAIKIYQDSQEKAEQQKELLTKELNVVLTQWKDKNIEVSDVFWFLDLVKEQGYQTEADTQQVYRDAALYAAAKEKLTDYQFVDFDQDGREELLGLNIKGSLVYYIMQEEFACASAMQENFAAASFSVTEDKVIVAESEAHDTFAVYRYSGDHTLESVYVAEEILHCERNDSVITFDIKLKGSIDRFQQYIYDLHMPEVKPAAVQIEWQKEAYPMPQTAEETARRYFEALGYQISEEADMLRAKQADTDGGFSFDLSDELETPDMPLELEISAYDVSDDRVLFEISYVAAQSQKKVYAAIVKEENWKVAGFAQSFAAGIENEEQDDSAVLLALNQTTTARLKDKTDRHVYRILVSAASRTQMIWQVGESAKDKEAFTVSLYRAEEAEKPIFSYNLKLTTAKQASSPLFLAPGVYYVAVEAKNYEDCAYSLTMQADQNVYAETEENDLVDQANHMELNQAYSASLYEKNDVDTFLFSLEQPGAVKVVLNAAAGESKRIRYQFSVSNAATGTKITSAQMAGNVAKTDTGTVYLDAGNYILQVMKGEIWSSGEYQVTAEYTEAKLTEIENNNTQETATVIPVNETVTGSFGIEGDVDYFRFTLETDAIVQPQLTFDPLESSSKTYVMTLLKGTEKLQTVNIGGRESSKVIQALALKAGTYTLKLENPRFAKQDYRLLIKSQKVDVAEQEENDTLAKATPLNLGTKMTGVLATKEDIDFFKIVLEGETVLTLTFAFPQSTENNTAYTIHLEQNGRSLWKQNVKEESGGFEQKLQIPEGEYYLCIEPVTWNNSLYTIGIE